MSESNERLTPADPLLQLLASMDASVWAKEFCRIAAGLGVVQKEDPSKTHDTPTMRPIDEGWMLGWFANAIMVGYDHGGRHAERRMLGSKEEPRTLDEVEKCAIRHALELYPGNMSAAARHLGIDRRTLYRKVGSQKKREEEQERSTTGESCQPVTR